jgi:hypothetical protein
LARKLASFLLKWDFKRSLITQNYTISHPQTEEVDGEEEEIKNGFLELYSTHCVGTSSTHGNAKRTEPDPTILS